MATLLDERPRAARRRRRRRTRAPTARASIAATIGRLDEPLRVAIAGKVKAGKSTLLNALVGEELAPDRRGRVHAHRHLVPRRHHLPGAAAPRRGSPSTRSPSAATTARHPDRPRRRRRPTTSSASTVEWPSSSLRAMTLIDTPGLASLSSDISQRTARVPHARRRPRDPGRRGALPDAAPAQLRHPLPRGVPRRAGRPGHADQRGRRAVAGRRDRCRAASTP